MEEIFIHNRYKSKKLNCISCGDEIILRLARIKEEGNICQSCAVKNSNKASSVKNCKRCGEMLTDNNRYIVGKKKRSTFAYCKSCMSTIGKEKRLEQKKLVMNHYGGKCSCCPENHIEFLTLDHVNNDGRNHRVNGRLHVGEKLYRELIRNNFQSEYEFQILCWNCNEAKENYGVCPHKIPPGNFR